MFIITNCTANGNYTPSKAETYEGAYEWMMQCMAENIRLAFEYEARDLDDVYLAVMSDKEVIEWAQGYFNGYDFGFNDYSSYINYDDGSFNELQIWDTDKI